MGGDPRRLLCLDLPPTPQQGDSRLTGGDRIPGEGRTCLRSGHKFRSSVTGSAQVTPFGPVASSRRKTKHFRGARGGSPSAVRLHEECGDSTGDHKATAGQRTVSENELLFPAAEGAGTRSKTPKAQTAHDTKECVRARAGGFAKQGAGVTETLGGWHEGGAPPRRVCQRLGRVRGTPETASEIRRLCQRAGNGGTRHPRRAGPGEELPRGVTRQVPGWFNNHRRSTAKRYGSRTP